MVFLKKILLYLSISCILSLITPYKALADNIFFHDGGETKIINGYYNSNSQEILIGLEHNLNCNWQISWQDPGDAAFPTMIYWHNSTNVKNVNILWPNPKRVIDNINNKDVIQNYVYNNKVILPIIITPIDSTKDVILDANINFSICNDICKIIDFAIKETIKPNFIDNNNIVEINKFMEAVPKSISNFQDKVTIDSYHIIYNDSDSGELSVTLNFKSALTNNHDIFVNSFNIANFRIPIIHEDHNILEIKIPFKLHKNYQFEDIKDIQLVLTNNQFNYFIDKNDFDIKIALPHINKDSHLNLYMILIFSLLGGLILNIMPCVFPVLMLKLMSLLKSKDKEQSHLRFGFIISSIGIIFSFIILSLIVIFLKYIGYQVGWGFHFQEPIFIIILTLIIFIFAMIINDNIKISPPQFINKVPIFKNKYTEDFFSGMLATILATPCTAPFLGTAVGFALTTTYLNLILIFIFIGIGLAFPYIIFAIFPQLIKIMPKSGSWMNIVKKLLAISLLITTFWLIWILSNQLDNISALIIIFNLILLKFIIETKNNLLRKIKALLILIIISISIYLPIYKNKLSLTHEKYIDSLWIDFDPDKIPNLIAQGNIVIVDVTADWCITCKVNKFLVLDRDDTLKLISQPNIIAMRADWTNRDDTILSYLIKHNKSGVPFNIIYGPHAKEGLILPTLISHDDIKNAINQSR